MERFLVHRSLCDWELWTTSQVMHIFFPRNWWLSGVWVCVNLELDYWRILCPMTAMTWSGGLEPMHLSSSPKCKRIDGWMESCKGNALRYWPKIGIQRRVSLMSDILCLLVIFYEQWLSVGKFIHSWFMCFACVLEWHRIHSLMFNKNPTFKM